ncbi:hypothetical protein H9Q69_009408 [Fusarium xylarioides]|nr:hypothetical protein H9Q69_009408 [Fusarium xylarioides]KAG5801309.1 hypothetical protein H9Q71_014114 [Fusarium xylarioides]KAG5810105.1 hypothetical protein H9Q74_014093 [Fusarium xylarioides]
MSLALCFIEIWGEISAPLRDTPVECNCSFMTWYLMSKRFNLNHIGDLCQLGVLDKTGRRAGTVPAIRKAFHVHSEVLVIEVRGRPNVDTN